MAECTVCISPLIAMVTSMTDCGATAAEISDATGIDVSEIEQHFVQCCNQVGDGVAENSMAASDLRLHALLARINVAATASGLQGNLKDQLSAMSIALRAELELRRRLETRAESEGSGELSRDPHDWSDAQRKMLFSYLDWVLANPTPQTPPRPYVPKDLTGATNGDGEQQNN